MEKAGKTIEMRDLFIGTIALEEGFAVATQNRDHFKRIPGLQVLSEQELLSRL